MVKTHQFAPDGHGGPANPPAPWSRISLAIRWFDLERPSRWNRWSTANRGPGTSGATAALGGSWDLPYAAGALGIWMCAYAMVYTYVMHEYMHT